MRCTISLPVDKPRKDEARVRAELQGIIDGYLANGIDDIEYTTATVIREEWRPWKGLWRLETDVDFA